MNYPEFYLRFLKSQGSPPLLNDGTQDIQYNGYIIGSFQDPHWRMYPIKEFLTARTTYSIQFAFTDYPVLDGNHYLFYFPENDGPTRVYSQLLRRHFDRIFQNMADYKLSVKNTAQIDTAKINKERSVVVKRLLLEQKSNLKIETEKLNKLKDTLQRDQRSTGRRKRGPQVDDNVVIEKAQEELRTLVQSWNNSDIKEKKTIKRKYDEIMNDPDYTSARDKYINNSKYKTSENTVRVLKSNINILENELISLKE